MNWYKKAQNQKTLEENPHYMDIGHPQEQPEIESPMFLWISDLAGNNFHKTEADPEYDHSGFIHDIGFDNASTINGRFDANKNVVSLYIDSEIATTIRYIPNRLISRLQQEFGNNITIIDYSRNPPKIVV